MTDSTIMLACRASVLVGLWAMRVAGNPCDLSQVSYCTWSGNDSDFWGPTDTGSLISFQTLPDGTPSFGGAAITPAFNYVLQGALFTSPLPSLFISGNNQIGFGLTAYNSNIVAHNFISAQLTNPERGVGVYILDHTTLFAYDAGGSLITSVSHNVFSSLRFVGIKSVVPIARVVIDDFSNSVDMDNFTMIHILVPEPASAVLLLLTVPVLFRRSARGKAGKSKIP